MCTRCIGSGPSVAPRTTEGAVAAPSGVEDHAGPARASRVCRQKEAAGTILPLQRTHTGLMADCGTVSGGGGREWGCLPARHASLGRLQREGRGDNTAGQRARGRVAVCSSPPRLWSHRQGQGSRVGASPQRVPGSKRKRDETACCRLHIVDVREEHRLRGQSHGTAVQ